MRKKKYIVPRLACLLVTEVSCILAGSPTDRETGPESPDVEGPGGPEDGRAKQNAFSTWEDWDEY